MSARVKAYQFLFVLVFLASVRAFWNFAWGYMLHEQEHSGLQYYSK